MKRYFTIVCATALSFSALAACSNDPTLTNNGNTSGSNLTFQQIDRVGKPGVAMLFLPFAQHDAFNRDSPSNDLTNTAPKIVTFVTSTPAGRSAAVASYVSNLVLPDALIVNLTSSATRASYLGYETNGALKVDCTGAAPTNFGGRAPADDVVTAMLSLAFGNTATTISAPNAGTGLTPAPPDNREQTGIGGRPQLSTDNVSCLTGTGGAPAKSTLLGSFPYLHAPV